MELLDFRRAVPLLLTAEVGYFLEVEVVDWNCRSVDHLVVRLREGLLLLEFGFCWVHCCLDCLDHLLLTQCLHCWIHEVDLRAGTWAWLSRVSIDVDRPLHWLLGFFRNSMVGGVEVVATAWKGLEQFLEVVVQSKVD